MLCELVTVVYPEIMDMVEHQLVERVAKALYERSMEERATFSKGHFSLPWDWQEPMAEGESRVGTVFDGWRSIARLATAPIIRMLKGNS